MNVEEPRTLSLPVPLAASAARASCSTTCWRAAAVSSDNVCRHPLMPDPVAPESYQKNGASPKAGAARKHRAPRGVGGVIAKNAVYAPCFLAAKG